MKKEYMKPVMETDMLQHSTMILAGSDPKFGVNKDADPVDPEDTW